MPDDHAAHPHSHSHSHSHGIGPDADRRRLAAALALIVAFMAVEVAAAVVAHSLALLSDAGHMLSDAAAIGFSLGALALAARPPSGAVRSADRCLAPRALPRFHEWRV